MGVSSNHSLSYLIIHPSQPLLCPNIPYSFVVETFHISHPILIHLNIPVADSATVAHRPAVVVKLVLVYKICLVARAAAFGTPDLALVLCQSEEVVLRDPSRALERLKLKRWSSPEQAVVPAHKSAILEAAAELPR